MIHIFRSAVLVGLLLLPIPARSEPPGATQGSVGAKLVDIKRRGFVRCGGVLRPGLVMSDGKDWSGLEVEICRAVAVAVFGAAARYSFHDYGSDKAFDAVRDGADDISFLTFAEMSQQKVADRLLPGPPVFIESLDMMVAEDSPAMHFGDMAGKGICFMIGTAAENELEAWFHDSRLEFIPYAFQEEGEKFDTYNVQRCPAVVDESTALAEARRDPGINHLVSRLIAEHLLSFPVVAATPVGADSGWAAIVAWTIATLVNADARESEHHAGGLKAMAVSGEGLGLMPGWQKLVVERVGSYSDVFARTLGRRSPLKLEQGLNRRTADGGALVVPFRD